MKEKKRKIGMKRTEHPSSSIKKMGKKQARQAPPSGNGGKRGKRGFRYRPNSLPSRPDPPAIPHLPSAAPPPVTRGAEGQSRSPASGQLAGLSSPSSASAVQRPFPTSFASNGKCTVTVFQGS